MRRPPIDALEWAHRARARGLPYPAASAVARLVTSMSTDPSRRGEVFDELVSHFEDGLSAGRTVDQLLASFGEEEVAVDLLQVVERQRHLPRPQSPLPSPLRRRLLAMLTIPRDIRYGARRLLASPTFTLTAVLSLALGIGATTMVFSLVNAVFLRPTAIAAPEEVVAIYESDGDREWNVFSHPTYVDLREATTDLLSGLAASRFVLAQQDADGAVTNLLGEAVSGDYFETLGIVPAVGRLLRPSDDLAPGAHPVVVLDFGYWQGAYGGDPGVVGRTLRLNARPYEVVGVAPREHRGSMGGIVPQFYASLAMTNELTPSDTDQFVERGNHSVFLKARLRPGITIAGVETRLASLARDIRAKAPEEWGPKQMFLLLPASEVIVFPAGDGPLKAVGGLMLLVVAMVLLVVCANLASFLLARGLDRRREIAVRMALGATRGQLVRQLVTETALLGVLGGVVGLGVAVVLGKLLTTADLPVPLPITVDLSLDWRVLLFAGTVSLLAGALLGVMPAWRASGLALSQTLHDESAGSTGGRGRVTLSHLLVGAQVALSLVLLVAAGLFVRSLQHQEAIAPGFGDAPTGLMQVVFAGEREADLEARLSRRLLEQRQLSERIGAIPGVVAVGMIDNIHLNLLNTQNTAITVPGVDPPVEADAWSVDFAVADGGFFEAAGIGMLEGRDFSTADGREAPRVAVINAAMARRFWPEQSAVGQVFNRGALEYVVIGVVETAKIRSLGEAPRPAMYAALSQSGASSVWYVARTTGEEEATAQAMLRVLRESGTDLIPAQVRTMTRHLDVMTLPIRLGVVAVASLAILALVLAVIGLYGAVSYAVARRTREVGIRLALGAEGGAVVRILMGTGVRVVLAGVVVGLVLAALVARLMSGLLFGVRAVDPVTFLLVPLLLVGVATLAAWLPARRAMRIPPSHALRAE